MFNLIDIISVILLLYTGSETTDYDTHGFIPCLTNILLYLKVLGKLNICLGNHHLYSLLFNKSLSMLRLFIGSLKTLNISMALFLYSVVEVSEYDNILTNNSSKNEDAQYL